MNSIPLNQDINYLQGQIHGLHALLLAVANLTVGRAEFQQEGLIHLQSARDTVLALLVAERTLAGIDATETWLLNVT